MRVALLHYSCPPVVGGVESVLAIHARLLAHHGHAVKILTGRGGSLGAGIEVKILRLLGSRHPRVLAVAGELDRGVVSAHFRALREEIADGLRAHLDAADVAMVHNVLTMHKNLPFTAALHMLISEGKKMVAWTHDLAWANPQYADRFSSGYPWSLLRAPLSVEYVAISEAVRAQMATLIGLSAESISVIPHGIDPADFNAWTAATQSLIRSIDLLGQDCVLISPVRITRRKNLEMAIRVVAALKARGWRLRLLITGPPGPHNPENAQYLEDLRDLGRALHVEADVVFVRDLVSRCSSRVVGDLYTLSDAVFLTSTLEGYGLPVQEAALFRLPVFCTDIPAFREVGGARVHYFRPGDAPEHVAARIAQILEDDRAYVFRRHVRQSLTWDRIYDRHIAPLLCRVAGEVPAMG
ncbi:MAG: glycosyltransferase family 4 protein [Armatimonadetes bacterium]|nr:glycosyltransferase family 4 protein [Armatimonadota bacterium]